MEIEVPASAVAQAIASKPPVDPKIIVVTAAVVLTAAGTYAFLRYRKAKKAEVEVLEDAAE